MDQSLGTLGSGIMGQSAANTASIRQYVLYTQEAQALGQTPVPYPQWMQMQQQAPQPGQPGMSQTAFSGGQRPDNREQLMQLLKARAMGGQ